ASSCTPTKWSTSSRSAWATPTRRISFECSAGRTGRRLPLGGAVRRAGRPNRRKSARVAVEREADVHDRGGARAGGGGDDGALHPRGQIARGVDAGDRGLEGVRVGGDEAIVVEGEPESTHDLDLMLGRVREEHLAGDACA